MIRTSVPPKMVKSALFRGGAWAFVGMSALVAAGAFLPLPLMRTWGLGLFLASLGLVTWGLLPYRRLSLLQSQPNELRLSNDNFLEFWSKKKCRLRIPFQSIERLEHTEKGIVLWVKKDKKNLVIKYQSDLDLSRYQVRKGGEGEYFFLFFSKRAYEELREELEEFGS